jgi:hypothetical protein
MNKLLPAALVMITILLSARISAAQVVYNDDIQPIFNARCIACHGGTSGVTLSSYTDVMTSVGVQYSRTIVEPGEPDQSPIVNKIGLNPTHGDRMPQGGPYLSDAQINLIRQWIAEGALETPATNLAENGGLPVRFELLGNFPNPFNPTTNIRFTLPTQAGWNITVYSAGGRFVLSESGRSQGGVITVPVNLESVSSGMYFFVVEIITSGPTRERLTGSMLLVK